MNEALARLPLLRFAYERFAPMNTAFVGFDPVRLAADRLSWRQTGCR